MILEAIKDVARHVACRYDSDPEVEWVRLDRHRTELALTLRAMDEHLPPPPARVLDCGGGPGRYAIELSKRGYEVLLFDLSLGNLSLARAKAGQASVTLAGVEHGTATDLGRFSDATFDVVLLMGPLYHLLEDAERRQALSEAWRVLKPGGQLYTAFITRYATMRYAAAREVNWILDELDTVQVGLETGVLPPHGEMGSSFVAYFIHPKQVKPLLQDAGFEVTTVLGVEGLVSMIEEGVNALEGEDWERWVDLNYQVSPDPCLHGGVEHLLAIAVKPWWRSVLRQIVLRLNAEGMTYKVVGGTSIALQGVPIRVSDIDIELRPEDAYRFQSLFPENVIKPVELCNNEIYRSHFGRFDFDGVIVEIMADLHRWEKNAWVPSMALTETVVDLKGLSVCAPWVEEETLAYIRRGRMGRVARCIPFCDAAKLDWLIRGE